MWGWVIWSSVVRGEGASVGEHQKSDVFSITRINILNIFIDMFTTIRQKEITNNISMLRM